MASLLPGYEYDIFISYRQKDNKYDGWVTEFVDNLKRELEATFKEEISVYFDINPHDGLLETYDVDASLKEKLKCLIFIPIISRTYCDPKSFAWEHEFVAFVEQALKDQFGLKVKLPNGNVANRVLPVRIHDLDKDDIKLCESVLGGVLRGVEFIYKEPGVNKPLTSEDDEKKNLNKTKYRIQINKIANAIKEIISGLMAGEVVSGKEKPEPQLPWEEGKKERGIIHAEKPAGFNKSKALSYIISVVFVLVLLVVYIYPKIFKRDTLEKLRSSEKKISVAVMPFQNLTTDTICNALQYAIQTSLISSLANTRELFVRQKEIIDYLLQTKGHSENNAISPSNAGTISRTLDADIFIYGSIQHAGSTVRINTELIDTRTEEVLKSFEINGPYDQDIIFNITDSLRKEVTDFLLISKLIKGNPLFQHYRPSTNSPEAFRYFINGSKAENKGDFSEAINWYLKALTTDSSYIDADWGLSNAYHVLGMHDQNLKILIKLYKERDHLDIVNQLWVNKAYADLFESPDERIKWLKQIQKVDDQNPLVYSNIGQNFNSSNQYDKAIIEFNKYLEIAHKLGINLDYIYALLGETYHKAGQYKEEKEIYRKAELETSDHASITFSWIIKNQATLSLAEKDSSSANKYISKYISVLKENSFSEANMAILLANIYSAAGIPDKAKEFYRKAVSLEPENPVFLNSFAAYLCTLNQGYEEFIRIIDKAITFAPNKWEYYNYLDTKGYGLYKLGKFNEGAEIMQKTWDETPYKMYFIKSHLEEVKKAVAGQK
jgi:tetratricopeptide (TPR) repeat protein